MWATVRAPIQLQGLLKQIVYEVRHYPYIDAVPNETVFSLG